MRKDSDNHIRRRAALQSDSWLSFVLDHLEGHPVPLKRGVQDAASVLGREMRDIDPSQGVVGQQANGLPGRDAREGAAEPEGWHGTAMAARIN